jgi:putative ABC transport system ATP-binding protein
MTLFRVAGPAGRGRHNGNVHILFIHRKGSSMIRVRNLSMRMSSGGRAVQILEDILLEVPKGQFLAIVGPSGSGKSTLLALIAGLDSPTSGSVALDGVDLSELDEDRLTALRGRLIGFVFQSYQLIPSLTALENVAVPLELGGVPDALDHARDLLNSVGLEDRLDHYPVQLSGGEQQRVALARAFARKPPILLADEPTGNLDTSTGKKIIDLLIQLHREQNNTMVLVTHNALLAERADRVIALQDGRIIQDRRLSP